MVTPCFRSLVVPKIQVVFHPKLSTVFKQIFFGDSAELLLGRKILTVVEAVVL